MLTLLVCRGKMNFNALVSRFTSIIAKEIINDLYYKYLTEQFTKKIEFNSTNSKVCAKASKNSENIFCHCKRYEGLFVEFLKKEKLTDFF